MANICKGSNRQITKNFTEDELHSKSLDAPKCHYLDTTTINALQVIRDWYNTPITVTSTLRTKTGNALVGGVSNSRHLAPASAIDFVFSKNHDATMKKFYEDFKCKGPLHRKLRGMGINGIGIYKEFIHIDTRVPTPSFWDESAGKWGDTRITNSYMSQIPSSGLDSIACNSLQSDSDYGLTGALSPLDPNNYSGEDGIKSNEDGLWKLLVGGVLILGGGIALLVYRKSKKIPTDMMPF